MKNTTITIVDFKTFYFLNMKKLGPILSNSSCDRDIHCNNYSNCLGLAVALNWNSFSCEGCKKQINTQLIWKAHAKTKSNQLLEVICQPKNLRRVILKKQKA